MHHIEHSTSLTPLYCLHQAAYFFSMAGISAFAVTYLMNRGFGSAQIGVMLATTNVLSCLLQPVIGSRVDKTSIALLQRIIPGFLIAALVSLASIELFPLPQLMVGVLYVAGYLAFSITLPLLNPLCAYYARSGYAIDYGAGNGTGSLSFSFASLGFGYIIARLGNSALMLVVLLFIAVQLLLVLRYPKVHPEQAASGSPARADQSLSILSFSRRYRLFMLTMIGVLCLAACHAMAENYLIQVFTRIGGGSEHVGVALFLACITAAPFMIFFERIQRRISVTILLRLCGVFYIIKALLLIWSPTITSVYLIELLQTVTYAFLYPSLYYLVLMRIAPADMAKGQTLASALFTLGMALGNSLGGIALERLGLSPMLAIAACIACAGTLLINVTIARCDAAA
ncbi:MAG: MFS transporter [Clostridia bacterium]|nr:MFS transporter [Clostridia bacterium]